MTFVLVRVLSTWPKLGSSGKREARLRKCLHRQGCKAYFWLMFDVRGPCPLWAVASLGRVVWESKLNTIMKNKPVSSVSPQPLLRFLPPGSWLSSCLDFSQEWPVTRELKDKNNPFFYRLLSVMMVYHSNRNPTLFRVLIGHLYFFFWELPVPFMNAFINWQLCSFVMTSSQPFLHSP